jgi:hypothetical protein
MLGWDETFIGQYLPRLIQSMSGGGGSGSGTGGPGNALMSAFAKVVQGQMPKKAADEFERLGLAKVEHIEGSSQSIVKGIISGDSHLKGGFRGKAGQVKIGGIEGADLFIKNPYEWVQSVLMPHLKEHGITKQEDIIKEISQLFPVRTASQVITEMGLQGRFALGAQSQFEKDAAQARQSMGAEKAYGELSANDPNVIMASFWAQWKAMTEAIGSVIVGPAMEGMKAITSIFTTIAQFAGAHPEGVKIAAEGIAVLGVALIALGGGALLAAIGPLIGAGGLIFGLVAALGALAAFNWSSITSAIGTFIDDLRRIKDGLSNLFKTPSGPIDFGTRPSTAPPGTMDFGGRPSITTPPGPTMDFGTGSPKLEKQSWNAIPPPKNERPIVLSSVINLDGQTIADNTQRAIASSIEHPTTAAYADGSRYAWDGGMQTNNT